VTEIERLMGTTRPDEPDRSTLIVN